MKDRIKLIRKNAGLTQQEFASKIGVSRNTIATYETSVRIPIDAIVKSLCREFGVNEIWLRTGEGNMYLETSPDLALSKWFGHLLRENPDSFKKRFVMTLSRLSDSEWHVLEKMIDTLHSKKTE
ncbi:MAG: helix-turn-helix transcriptional regulator [Eubacteriales bacterium]|nr:helix-turn-helix transcriptional regulator [Eubacteriales bacterium]